jgi:hypothetical protein
MHQHRRLLGEARGPARLLRQRRVARAFGRRSAHEAQHARALAPVRLLLVLARLRLRRRMRLGVRRHQRRTRSLAADGRLAGRQIEQPVRRIAVARLHEAERREVRRQRVGRAVVEHAAFGEQHDDVEGFEDARRRLVDAHREGAPGGCKPVQRADQPRRDGGVQAARRLVLRETFWA